MSEQKSKPKVGLGIIIVNEDGKILVGKRKGSHAPYYSIPGGSLDLGETFEEGAIREVKEETGLDIKNSKVIAVSNNVETFKNEGVHFISVFLFTKDFSGIPSIIESEKCEEWLWSDPKNLPTPHFEASQNGVGCYLENVFYKENS